MIFNELIPIIQMAFPDEKLIQIQMSKNDLDSWDSIGHLNLILEIEDNLKISFTQEEIELIQTFEILIDIINRKI